MMPDVVVIGAGISGAASAYELATAGLSVLLLDRYGPAAMASGWTLAGVRQSGRHPAELPLARAAVALWGELSERLGADVRYRRRGNLRLARTEAEVP
ncbi:MAG TPA: FAD-dependent oxidoreductase, partial [Acetobacteraceae bacterium]|nr:FAD-dependent oxidoreductase [Acetobacteraceae bacterium]